MVTVIESKISKFALVFVMGTKERYVKFVKPGCFNWMFSVSVFMENEGK